MYVHRDILRYPALNTHTLGITMEAIGKSLNLETPKRFSIHVASKPQTPNPTHRTRFMNDVMFGLSPKP